MPKFRIIDMLALTTLVAMLAGSFQFDLTLFRQLLCCTLVCVFSTVAVFVWPNSKRSQFAAAIGGFLAAVVYQLVATTFSGSIYDEAWMFHGLSNNGPVFSGRSKLLPETPFVFAFAIFFGTTLGPLFAMYFRRVGLAEEFKKSIKISIGLLAGLAILIVFASFDRKAMQGRDWAIVVYCLATYFVIHTYGWQSKFFRTDSQSHEVVEDELAFTKETQ